MQNFCSEHDIKMFDRVVEIQVESFSIDDIGLNSKDFSATQYLSKVSVSMTPPEETLASLKQIVPKQRLVSLENRTETINGMRRPNVLIATLKSAGSRQ